MNSCEEPGLTEQHHEKVFADFKKVMKNVLLDHCMYDQGNFGGGISRLIKTPIRGNKISNYEALQIGITSRKLKLFLVITYHQQYPMV